ncbi:hypothetical protein CB1_001533028 [Camelus ferus]|nr:hypothetical protein CB1_001533028 [Camelus ferus]
MARERDMYNSPGDLLRVRNKAVGTEKKDPTSPPTPTQADFRQNTRSGFRLPRSGDKSISNTVLQVGALPRLCDVLEVLQEERDQCLQELSKERTRDLGMEHPTPAIPLPPDHAATAVPELSRRPSFCVRCAAASNILPPASAEALSSSVFQSCFSSSSGDDCLTGGGNGHGRCCG